MTAYFKDRNNKGGSGKECISCEMLRESDELLRMATKIGYDACKVVGCSDPQIRGEIISKTYQQLVKKEAEEKLKEKEIKKEGKDDE